MWMKTQYWDLLSGLFENLFATLRPSKTRGWLFFLRGSNLCFVSGFCQHSQRHRSLIVGHSQDNDRTWNNRGG